MNEKSKLGICQMCLSETSLCEAHLQAKALKNLILEGGSRTLTKFKKNSIIRNENDSEYRVSQTQNLEFDREILCQSCDNILGNYDKALVEFYRAYTNSDIRKRPEKDAFDDNFDFFEYNNTDSLIYLGFAASLFRHSISERATSINLGKYQDIFKEALVSRDHKNLERYFTICAWGTYCSSPDTSKLLFPIGLSKNNGIHCYYNISLGITILMFVTNRSPNFSKICDRSEEISNKIFFKIVPEEKIVFPLLRLQDSLQFATISPIMNQIRKATLPSTPTA